MIEDYSYNDSKIKIKKDYFKKSFANPYFDKFKRGFNTKLYLQIFLIIFLVYVFFYSDFFKVKNIEIQGSDLISKDEINSTITNYLNKWTFFILPKNNLIILNKSAIKNEVLKKYSVDSIEINKGWQNLKVSIKEKICYLIVYNQKSYFYIALDGTVIKQLDENEVQKRIKQLPVLNINKDIVIGEKVFSVNKIDFILALDKELKKHNLKPKSYEDRGVVEIAVAFEEGWEARLDMNSDITLSVENLKLILDKKIKDRKSLQYIDLRMGDKIYYK